MSEASSSVGFADRHSAVMDLMKALKSYLDLPKAELMSTAREIEETCAAEANSREDYLQSIRRRQEAIKEKATATANADLAIPTTTGSADEPGAETQAIGKYQAVYHERSLNAVIYKTTDLSTGSACALKLVSLDSQLAPHNIEHEARFLRMLSGHANIITLLASEPMAGGLFALKLPFFRYDLSSLASQAHALTAAQKKRHLRDLFTALAAVHDAGIIHRDVKPSNVLLHGVDGPAVLMDFGISWHADVNARDEPADAKMTDVGTGAYRPPELLFGGKAYGTELDAWAAGCAMAEVLVGKGKTLFDAGIVSREDFLGSDLTLVNSLFRKLGTPTDETWPEAATYRDWGKIEFKEFPALSWRELLPDVGDEGRDLVSKLVIYSSRQRLSAHEALKHPFFASDT